jgi:hypothetical protein
MKNLPTYLNLHPLTYPKPIYLPKFVTYTYLSILSLLTYLA